MHNRLEFYLQSIGFKEKDIIRIIDSVTVRDEELVKSKIEDYKRMLNVTDSELRRMVLRWPAILGRETKTESQTSVKTKMEFYKNLFQLGDQGVRTMILRCPYILGLDITGESEASVRGKMKAFKELFNLTDSEVIKCFVRFPVILSLDINGKSETSIRSKVEAYKQILNLNDDEVKKVVLTFPQWLGLDPLSDRPTSVKGKISACKQMLDLTDEQIKIIVVRFPQLLGSDIVSDKNSSFKNKINKIKEIIPLEQLKEYAVKYPLALAIPANSFKIRYMLATLADGQAEFFTGGTMTNEKKVFARLCYLKEHELNLKAAYRSEANFSNYAKANSEDLMKQYPLSKEMALMVESAYKEKTGKTLTLDQDEYAELGL